MNENIDLTKILKDCPKGTKLYSTVFGEVEFDEIKEESNYPIVFVATNGDDFSTTANGKHYKTYDGECTLFPSKDQRDWSKFTAPWYKKEKFYPKTLQPFDKILVKRYDDIWAATLLSHYDGTIFTTINNGLYESCIPYNEETKHLLGTREDCPEYYKWWEE